MQTVALLMFLSKAQKPTQSSFPFIYDFLIVYVLHLSFATFIFFYTELDAYGNVYLGRKSIKRMASIFAIQNNKIIFHF